jgi:phage shock protein A
MATKAPQTPDNRLAEALEVAERRRHELNELGRELNERGLALEKAQAGEADAVRRAEQAEQEAARFRAGWAGLEQRVEDATAKANESVALAAAATAARVAAEDDATTLRVLHEEARASLARLEPENASLRGKVAGFELKVATAEDQIEALVASAKRVLRQAAEAASEAIAPTAASLRERVLEIATEAPADADPGEFLDALQEQLAGVLRDERVDSEHARRATAERAEMVRRVAADAATKLDRDVAEIVAGLR